VSAARAVAPRAYYGAGVSHERLVRDWLEGWNGRDLDPTT